MRKGFAIRRARALCGRLKGYLADELHRRIVFFRRGAQANAHDNATVLIGVGMLMPVVVLLSFAITYWLFPGWEPSVWHQALIPMPFVFALATLLLRRADRITPVPITVLSVLFQLTMLGLVAAIDSVGSPDKGSLFLQTCIAAFAVVFVLPSTVQTLIVAACEAFYVALSWGVKDVFVARADTLSALAGFFACMFLVQIVVNVRLRGYEAGALYKALSRRDALTGLMNKAALIEGLEAYLEASRPQVSCALIMVDVDNFKQVNDGRGHLAGDDVLMCVARALAETFRPSGLVARFGGDEFSVVVKHCDDAAVLAEKLDALQERARACDASASGEVTLSIGAVVARDADADATQLFVLADEALYATKRQGKASYTIVDYRDDDTTEA